jgi:hypothetical protein
MNCVCVCGCVRPSALLAFMYVCMHAYFCVCQNAHHLHKCECMYVCMHVYDESCIFSCVLPHIYDKMCKVTFMPVYVCMYAYMYIYKYTYMCMCIHKMNRKQTLNIHASSSQIKISFFIRTFVIMHDDERNEHGCLSTKLHATEQ